LERSSTEVIERSPAFQRPAVQARPLSISRTTLREITMFDLSIGVGELVLRAVVVYAALFTLVRIGGKKHVGDLSPFDLVVLLILSETVQGALVADDKSLIGGLLSAATLLAIVHAVGYVSWRYKKVERILEGRPRVLVRHGHVYRDVMTEERVTHSELIEATRREGCATLTNVRYAVLENDGTITVGLKQDRA
jgi:uncharacterized membrane protein YcaP (DUF421 family)